MIKRYDLQISEFIFKSVLIGPAKNEVLICY